MQTTDSAVCPHKNMFSLFRMVSYFWELGGDVLALYHCKSNLFGFPCPSRTPLSGCLKSSYDQGRVSVQLSTPQLWFHFAAVLSQHLPTTAADQHTVFPAQSDCLPPSFFSCLQPHVRSPATNGSCHISPDCGDLQTESSPPRAQINKQKELYNSTFLL